MDLNLVASEPSIIAFCVWS